MGLKRFFQRVVLGKDDGVIKRPLEQRDGLDSEYYQGLHDKHSAYQSNNWLLNEPVLMQMIGGKTVMELGCGNGRFTQVASETAKHVYGLDWARSQLFDDSSDNVEFVQADALKATFPTVDVACSGDVLEHFKPEDILGLIAKLHECATVNFHVIACYDDKHSHLTIESKEWWLDAFQKHDKAYKLFNAGSEKRQVAIVSNWAG